MRLHVCKAERRANKSDTILESQTPEGAGPAVSASLHDIFAALVALEAISCGLLMANSYPHVDLTRCPPVFPFRRRSLFLLSGEAALAFQCDTTSRPAPWGYFSAV